MAAGCLPVIRNWAGADKIYPSRYVVRTVSEAAGMVRRWYLDGQFDKLGGEVRSFAQQNFDILPITSQYDQLISRLTGIEFQPCRISDGNAIKDEAIRLAFVCYLTPGKQSGYEIRVTEEAGLLSRHGITPWIVVFFSAKNNSPVEELEWYRKEMETKTGSRIKLMPTDHYFHLHDSEGLFKEIDKPMVDFIRQEKINILHAEALYAAHHCSRISVKTGCRLVFDNHGALPEETKMRGGNQNWIRRLEEVENQLLIDADLTVLVSHGMQNFYRTRYGVTLDTAQILPCCVHSDAFSLLPELRTRVRAEKGLSDRFVMLYLGTLSVWQWPDAMFGLFARIQQKFPDTFLYMLIPEYDHEAARNYLSTYGIPEDCYLLEEVPHQEVGHHIGLADAGFLLRETHEVNKVSSPTKFGEYLAAGVPVILTQGIGDYSDMADRMQVGLTLNMTSAEVSAEDFSRIESFIQNVKENRRIWSERCTGVAKRNLDWEKFGDILIRKYLRMINNNI
jgi:glycosyltransferase involved in cell wall biosynthesis